MLAWMKDKLESRLWGEISITTNMQMTPPLWQKESKEELKSVLMKVKEESEKLAYNSTFKKGRTRHPVPSLHGKYMGKQWKQ